LPLDAAADPTKTCSLVEALVQPVDQLRHRLQAVRDHAEPELAEVLRLDAEALRQRPDDVIGRYGPVAVHQVVQVAGGEPRSAPELAVRDSCLRHQGLDRRAEGILAESPASWHHDISLPKSATSNRVSSPVARSLTSTLPS